MTWTRWVGVASDPATLSGERLGRGGADVDVLSGTTTPGARVHVLDAADAPVTVAFADAAGGWSATVPRGDHRTVETGRGTGIVYDLPEGHGWPAPYEGEPASTLATLTSGSVSAPFAEGWGVAPLVAPGTVHVQVADGGPAVRRTPRGRTESRWSSFSITIPSLMIPKLNAESLANLQCQVEPCQ